MSKAQAHAPVAPADRRAEVALWGGILFAAAFTGLIWLLSGRLADIPFLPDQGALWYYWKRPTPTLWSRLTSWGFYALHQVGIWSLIWYAQNRVKRYTNGLHPVNLWALGLNGAFALIHLLQTHIWYDGLAQDVSILSSQGSVILMLVLVLIMENPRRGLFFGKKAPLPQDGVSWLRKYHGYIFSWAAIYTFWYHPMEGSSGHLIGFFYTFLLMLQGSLFLSRIHLNRWWTLANEVIVLIHGTIVAIYQGNGLWPMFAFGFGGIFIITQMHGLGWSRLTRWAWAGAYVLAVLWIYSQAGWARLNEVVRIPVIDYVLVFLLGWLIGGGLWLYRRLRPQAA